MRELLIVFLPLLFTISIEWIVFISITREKIGKTIVFAIIMNMISWPIATLLYWNWPNEIYWIELLVVAIESILISIYWKYKFLKAGLLSFSLNAASYFIGILVFK